MKPSVDVIILSWNRPAETVEAIHSALAQQGVDVRVQVVDQGSDAPTRQALEQLARDEPRVAVTWLERNLGVARGRNIAMRMGRAPVIVALDNDAVFASPGTLLQAVQRFEREPDLGAIGFRILNFHTGDDDRGSWAYPRTLLARRGDEFQTTRFCGCGHAIRRDALSRTQGYDDALFFYWEELDLGLQLVDRGYRIVYDPSLVVRHKVDPERRVRWDGERFFYLVRNAVYLDYKHFRSLPRSAAVALAYQVRGLRNGVSPQAVRGAIEAVRLIRSLPAGTGLGERARAYVHRHDTLPRGSVWSRLRNEVLGALPGSRP